MLERMIHIFATTEYCDEVSEPLDYNESLSISQRPLEPQKDSRKCDINFVSVESPPVTDDSSECGKDRSSTKEQRDSTPIGNPIQDPARKSVLELFNMIPAASICPRSTGRRKSGLLEGNLTSAAAWLDWIIVSGFLTPSHLIMLLRRFGAKRNSQIRNLVSFKWVRLSVMTSVLLIRPLVLWNLQIVVWTAGP